MNINKTLTISVSIIATLSAFDSHSALLVSGNTVALSGTTVAAEPALAGNVLNDNLISDFVSPSGNQVFGVGVDVQNRVVRSSLSGNLIFAPRIISTLNNTGGNFLIDSVVLNGFSGFAVDVNYRTDGLGDRGPNSATRSVDGDLLRFEFLFPITVGNLNANPQEDSYFFSINSNATAFSNTGNMRVFGRHLDYPEQTFSFSYSGMAVPVLAEVSEPAAISLFAACFGLLLLRTKISRKSKRHEHYAANSSAFRLSSTQRKASTKMPQNTHWENIKM